MQWLRFHVIYVSCYGERSALVLTSGSTEVRSRLKHDLFPYGPCGPWRIKHVSNYGQTQHASQLQGR